MQAISSSEQILKELILRFMQLFREKKTVLCYFALVIYIIILFYMTVLSREPEKVNIVYLHLFWGYDDPLRCQEKLLNIAIFIPVGLLAGFLFKRHRVLIALLIGLAVSLSIECSQLAWSRGEFDVDDLFNNTLGAGIGGVIAMLIGWLKVK